VKHDFRKYGRGKISLPQITIVKITFPNDTGGKNTFSIQDFTENKITDLRIPEFRIKTEAVTVCKINSNYFAVKKFRFIENNIPQLSQNQFTLFKETGPKGRFFHHHVTETAACKEAVFKGVVVDIPFTEIN
jgi:hypothetical protein